MVQPSSTKNPTKKLVVLCDGSWCGRETGTNTNISMIASAIGIQYDLTIKVDKTHPAISDPSRNLNACYFPGAGLGGSFLEYLFNGATANDIGKECMDAYQYIVNNFDNDTEIWMFGLSRGSYTARCVAGMINNCGIIKTRNNRNLVEEVYAMYRSSDAEDKPGAPNMDKFRTKASWDVESPIKVMALIDTVGSLGIPRLESGVGFEFLEFSDQNVSSQVQKVYHACSIHDRLWVFQPCRARRAIGFNPTNDPRYEIHERYFPGCHYDLGRQRFKFFRDGVNIIEKVVFSLPNHLTKPVIPNEVCSDLVLQWLLQAIRDNDPMNQILKNGADVELAKLEQKMKGPQDPGSGDVYIHPQDYTPAGIFGTALWNLTTTAANIANTFTPATQLGSAIQEFLGFRTIINMLLATRDRRIQNLDADVMDLQTPMKVLGNVSPYVKGKLYDKEPGSNVERYKSQTVAKWQLVRSIVNSPVSSTS
jgi:hypothetical protein